MTPDRESIEKEEALQHPRSFTNDENLNDRLERAIAQITAGEKPEDLTEMIKNKPTRILLADASHTEERYRPGNQLVTYNGVTEDGEVIRETWDGGVADIVEGSVILQNVDPITFPERHPQAGEVVMGRYDKDGTFVVDPEGDVVLHNEYVSDVDFVSAAYGVTPTVNWQERMKLQPSFVLEVPADVTTDVNDLYTEDAGSARVGPEDYIVVDTKKDKVLSVHGCEREWLEDTFIPVEDYLASLE